MTRIKDDQPCIIQHDTVWIWNLYKTERQAIDACKKLNDEEKEIYYVATYDEYLDMLQAKYLTGIVTQITKKEFWNALEVLPPLRWRHNETLATFCMSEFMIGSYTEQYACYFNKYYKKMIDYHDESTEIRISDLKDAIPLGEAG